mmetsp:Transcript_86346/g.244763  ORF Transcript_86346/g.244763 Transcript_86346/m.244763 type:complete len:318 (+) Transcript_86346:25-978(+)
MMQDSRGRDDERAPIGYSLPTFMPAVKSGYMPLRKRLNYLAAATSLLLPWLLFSVIFGAQSFTYPGRDICNIITAVGAIGVFVCGCLVYYAKVQKTYSPEYQASWFVFVFVTTLIAWVLAVALGSQNYESYYLKFQRMTHLGKFNNVDPSRIRGQQIMDVGMITFAKHTRMDLAKSGSFHNGKQYCVVPLTVGNSPPASGTYDFWVVGTDCCSGQSGTFHCMSARQPFAYAALRSQDDGDRAFYRLAVQQAEAKYKIKAVHPLFFEWMPKPEKVVQNWKDSALNNFLFGIFAHLLFQLFLVICATVVFAKMGDLRTV